MYIIITLYVCLASFFLFLPLSFTKGFIASFIFDLRKVALACRWATPFNGLGVYPGS